MGNTYLISGLAALHLAMLISLAVCTLSSEKRQQPNMAQVLNSLRSQIQTYERSLAECRRHIQLLTGRPQTPTNQRNSGTSGGWSWLASLDDRKRRRSVNIRQLYQGNYWNNNYNTLQNTLQTRVQEFNQCVAQLHSIRDAQEDIRNKQQVATNLLQQINVLAVNLRRCVSFGGRTSVSLPTLFLYISNGGFIQPQNTQPRQPAPSSYVSWRWVGGFEVDDRRRAVLPANVDWTQVLTQRQQWLTFVQQELVKCWGTIGRLPDGSLPTRAPLTPIVLPPQPPPPKTFPPPPPPPQPKTTVKPTTVATAPPTTTSATTVTTTAKPTSTTTSTTTAAPTTTTITTTLPTTTTQPRTTTTAKPTSTTTLTTTAAPTTATTTTTLPTTATQPSTTTTTAKITTTEPLTTTTLEPTTTTTTLNFTSTSAMYVTTTTGPGLTTTFAPLMTTSPC